MDYNTPVSAEHVTKTIEAMKLHGIEATVVATKADALAKVKELVPRGASVMNGSSRTLEQIGFVDVLKSGAHEWHNLHTAIVAETDPAKQAALRQQAHFADYYLGSAHAVAETGEMVIASASASQLPSLVATAKNIVLVVGTQKIVPTLGDALQRLEQHVFPLEDQRMKDTGAPGSTLAKILIFAKEPAWTGRKVHVVFVEEALGF